MKYNLLQAVYTIFLFVLAVSCKKDNNSTNNNQTGNGSLVRIQQGTDPNISFDTVFLINYDASSHISSIVDSLYKDTLFVTSNAAGNPVSVTETYGFSATYIYDVTGVLTQVDYTLAGSHEQDIFEYSNGVISKRTHNSNLGSGPVSIQGSYTYTVAGGNITDIKEYDLNGSFVKETTCTYGTETNAFKPLSLLNLGNIMGTENFLNLETYFNKNMLAGFSINGDAVSNAYSTYSSQEIVRVVSTDYINFYLFTWLLSYK